MIRLFAKVSDETLNKVGRRYNLFCMWTLFPYLLASIAALVVPALAAWQPFGLILQSAWVIIWIPNLLMIGVRAHRDYLASLDRMREWGKADIEFFAAHVERMALLRGEEPPAPPTLN